MTSLDAPPGYRSVLAVPQLRAVLAAHLVSMLGSVGAEVALSVLVYRRTGSSLLSAATLALGFLPHLLGGTVLSGTADRVPVRRLLVGCDLVAAALVTAMLLPGMPVAGLLVLVVLLGCLTPVFGSARSADLADALPPDLYLLARSLLRQVAQSSLVLGFALGGLVLAVVGPQWLLAGGAASFLASALLLRVGTPSRPARSTARRGPLATEALAGLRLLARRPALRRLLLLGWLPWTIASGADGLAVAYSAQVGAGAGTAGALLCALATGSVLGEVVAARLSAQQRTRAVLPLAGLMLVPLLGFVAAPAPVVAAGLLLVAGCGSAYAQGLDALVLQVSEPQERGRVLAVQGSGLMVLQGGGILAAGGLAEVLPPGTVLALGASAGLLLLGLLALRIHRR